MMMMPVFLPTHVVITRDQEQFPRIRPGVVIRDGAFPRQPGSVRGFGTYLTARTQRMMVQSVFLALMAQRANDEEDISRKIVSAASLCVFTSVYSDVCN